MTDLELTPAPALLDADPVTTDWPMPAERKWAPIPADSFAMRAARLWDSAVRAMFGWSDEE